MVNKFIPKVMLTAILALFAAYCGGNQTYLKKIEQNIIPIGGLNDASGPGAAIGVYFPAGKNILAKQVNAGKIKVLPEGWTVEYIDKDHSYNPAKSVSMFKEIKDSVLFIGTSFGTPNTLPLVNMLEADKIVAFPASLSSQMGASKYTVPLGPSYKVEAMRAVDFMVENAGSASKVKAGIVYQQDDYGKDGLAGLKAAAEKAGVAIVAEQTIAPGQKDFGAVVKGLQDAGATHVLISVLPSASGPLLGTAAKLGYAPVWIGSTPAWVDAFFNAKVLPPAVLGNYHQLSGLPFWGEDVPGMKAFEEAFAEFGDGKKNWYTFVSYMQGLIQLQIAAKAIESGSLTRDSYLAALNSLDSLNLDGMIQPVNLTEVPYQTSTKVRVLKPNLGKGSWTVVSDYADPKAL